MQRASRRTLGTKKACGCQEFKGQRNGFEISLSEEVYYYLLPKFMFLEIMWL